MTSALPRRKKDGQIDFYCHDLHYRCLKEPGTVPMKVGGSRGGNRSRPRVKRHRKRNRKR